MDILQKEYYCYMNEKPGSIITSQQVSVNGLLYNYTIQDAQITNAVGVVIATLTEYKLSGSAGDSISLYRTKEGNWYDMKQTDSPFKNAIMVALKTAIDQKVKMEFSR
jgi:hypothetical protein